MNRFLICLSIAVFGLSSDAWSAPVLPRPNILLIMVDDLGFADFGAYGSEIETPQIDRLAERGIRFSQFYNTAKCHSSRISLLTGQYSHYAGESDMARGVTIAQVLGAAGYATSMTGKWHLDGQPTDYGFQQYWGHLSGSTDFFAGDQTFRLNGKPWNDFGEDFYTTDANVDFSIQFLDNASKTGKPFFHYIAFNAPHYPLQARKDDIKKYLGRYDAGWEVLRQQRFAKQKQLGMFPENAQLPPLPKHVPAWDSLSDKQRQFEAFRMAVYAAMVDCVDRQVARMVAYLKKSGQYDNTLILICSDNGACPFERSGKLEIPPWKADSFLLYDASWATVGNTPFKHYKQTQHEGGISSPLIVSWPGRIEQVGTWNDEPSHLIDILVTCIDVAQTHYPDRAEINPLQGISLLPLLRGEARKGHDALFFEYGGCRALRQGDWKLVSFYRNRWELYDLSTDRMEQHDLAEQFPERVAEMKDRWEQIARGAGPDAKIRLAPVKQTRSPDVNKTWHNRKKTAGWQMPSF
ncbi:Arylsulfatase [Rosistilla carotiformis]|uniref:Arylsulfatase n=1 Tax=Rosistilla carotiformis TaxID=2528017 RepID=A0A518JR37_9BACT|nr:arylsulfatase [Rosistilla carotiformis]QDV68005.1 Arylsulfatase [Rosistilla carotiformis]